MELSSMGQVSAAACGLRLGQALLWPTHLTPLCVARKPQQGWSVSHFWTSYKQREKVISHQYILCQFSCCLWGITTFSEGMWCSLETYRKGKIGPQFKDRATNSVWENLLTLMTALAGWIWALQTALFFYKEKQKCKQSRSPHGAREERSGRMRRAHFSCSVYWRRNAGLNAKLVRLTGTSCSPVDAWKLPAPLLSKDVELSKILSMEISYLH